VRASSLVAPPSQYLYRISLFRLRPLFAVWPCTPEGGGGENQSSNLRKTDVNI
jgi:hypothetical protein